MKARVVVVLFGLLLVMPAAEAAVIDLAPWTVIQYEFNDQPDANWVLSNGNTVATQTVNADASILLSDFDATNTVINGSWRAQTAGDDDFMGFVFGHQGRGQYYLFDWKQADQNFGGLFAERGMSVKVVNIPGNADPTFADLWPTVGSPNVISLSHNTVPWADNTLYDFHLEFHPGQFTIEVREGSTVLLSQTISDNTFQSGRFGFYNYSQGPVQYQGFTLDPAPPTPTAVPEPASLTLFALGLLGGAVNYAWRRMQTKLHQPACG